MFKKDKTKEPYKYYQKGVLKCIYDVTGNKFKIGDRVEVIDDGQFYSTYESMIVAMGISKKNWIQHGLSDGDIGHIINSKIHENHEDPLQIYGYRVIYGVKITNVAYPDKKININKIALVGETGLKKLKNILLPDKLFEI